MSKIHMLLCASVIALQPAVAHGQFDPDVVVMRRTIAPPNRNAPDAPPSTGLPTPSPGTPQPTGTWKTGDPVVQPGCSATQLTVAPVTCVDMSQKVVANENCDAAKKPTGRGTAENYSQCTYKWITGVYSEPTPGCSAQAYKTRSVSCQRQDPDLTPVDAGLCDADSEDSKKTNGPLEYYEGCSYTPSYAGTYSTCVNNKQTTTITSCRRSDGENVAVSKCSPFEQTVTRACVPITCTLYRRSDIASPGMTKYGNAATEADATAMCRSLANTYGKGGCQWNGTVNAYKGQKQTYDASGVYYKTGNLVPGGSSEWPYDLIAYTCK